MALRTEVSRPSGEGGGVHRLIGVTEVYYISILYGFKIMITA